MALTKTLLASVAIIAVGATASLAAEAPVASSSGLKIGQLSTPSSGLPDYVRGPRRKPEFRWLSAGSAVAAVAVGADALLLAPLRWALQRLLLPKPHDPMTAATMTTTVASAAVGPDCAIAGGIGPVISTTIAAEAVPA